MRRCTSRRSCESVDPATHAGAHVAPVVRARLPTCRVHAPSDRVPPRSATLRALIAATEAGVIRVPNSLALHLLRRPPPFRLLPFLVAFPALLAVQCAPLNWLLERARLAGPLVMIGVARIDPVLQHAESGHWPGTGDPPMSGIPGDAGDPTTYAITDDGVEARRTVGERPVVVVLRPEFSPGSVVRWRCRLRAASLEPAVARLLAPSSCRE